MAVGLCVSLAFVIIFTCYTRQQFAVCTHYPESKNIYLVGIGGQTYSYDALAEEIENEIPGVDDAVLVGVGSLGHALLGNSGFDRCGVHIVAAFDRNEAMDGLMIHDKPVFSVRRLTNLCKRMHIRIGIITVSAEQAQIVCDQLVDAGILAIWNFAPVQLRVPENVLVKNEDLASSLAMLTRELQETLKRQL